MHINIYIYIYKLALYFRTLKELERERKRASIRTHQLQEGAPLQRVFHSDSTCFTHLVCPPPNEFLVQLFKIWTNFSYVPAEQWPP